MLKDPNWLHVYGSALWHDEVAILGSPQALEALAEAIRRALRKGEAVANCVATDGEGYRLAVIRVDDMQRREDIPQHYIDHLAGGPVTPSGLPEDIQNRIRSAARARGVRL